MAMQAPNMSMVFDLDDRSAHLAKRPRTESEAAENSMLSDHANSPQGQPLAKQRFSQDAIDYPRRRATIACEVCRSRKSKCDGSKPKCRLCTELNAECIYREPGVKLDAGDKLILQHLNRIENLIQSKFPQGQGATSMLSPTASNGTNDVPLTQPFNGLGTWSNTAPNISAMSKTHTTPAFSLLRWPLIRDLVSRPYDPQVLLQLEMGREPLKIPTSPQPDLTNIALYVEAFFQRANVWFACVNPYSWPSYYQVAAATGFSEGPESCIVLLVVALGCAASSGSISQNRFERDVPGMDYFAAAWKVLPSIMTRNDMLASQSHILAAAYLFYLVRPLDAWSLLTNTSMKLQLLLSNSASLPMYATELTERVYWNTLLFESDLLAELDLPHSGIVNYEESVQLPIGFENEGEEAVGRDELWYFLAEIALRRLLNRVSQTIYTKKVNMTNTSVLEPLVSELDHQLTEWYEALPTPVQFPRSRLPTDSPVQTVLRLRYFACRTIIFRPYILAVLSDETSALDPVVTENCKKCLEACIRQIEHITAHHSGHLPYLWQGALSIVSQTLLVMGSTMSPSLSALLPPAHSMDVIIADVVAEIERLSHLAPSLQLSAEILREAEERRRHFFANRGFRQ